ncbi:hypothetical protein N7532_003042 [Penicillium argentinense]|uniref:Kinesin-like protein n=1 Tax=Penicillium argentinense TaxID=1131581 RepID=A0A9W9FLS7_9EURO|nr:uncharacterized protein N7532_003042 [Penicillium argentinense]KAJ5102513.1 hypothetical protein N7532_003042 [Penicillium argentinense]
MDDENLTQSRVATSTRSRLPQPGLREMTSSTTNSRSGILPPGSIAKQAASVSPTRPKAPNPTDTKRSGSALRQPTNTTNTHTRGHSYASSTMSRTGSTASRSINAGFSSTIGSGSTRPTSAMSRPNPSVGPRKLNGSSMPRPATSMDTRADENAGSVLGKRKGEDSLPSYRLHSCPDVLAQGFDMSDVRNEISSSLPTSASQIDALSTTLSQINLNEDGPRKPAIWPPPKKPQAYPIPSTPNRLDGPSRVPVATPSKPSKPQSFMTPQRSPHKQIMPLFLTKDSSTRGFNCPTDTEWDHDLREKNMDEFFAAFMSRMNQQGQNSFGLKETVDLYKNRSTWLFNPPMNHPVINHLSEVNELEKSRDALNETNTSLRVETETLKSQLSAAEDGLKAARREQEIAMDDLDRRQRIELESVRQAGKQEAEALSSRHQNELQELKRKLESEIEDEKAVRVRELGKLTSQSASDLQKTEFELSKKLREIASMNSQLDSMKTELDRERKHVNDLRQNLDTASTNSVTLESTIRALKARIEFLEGGREEQSQAFERCNQEMMDALQETEAIRDKLRREETLRRKLHNQVQELKGNIRVFCRVRPSLRNEGPTDIAPMQYPDEFEDAKEINIVGPEEKNSLGAVLRKNNNFSFDRVFGPRSENGEVFDEISQLVQSALDGYNVCIFCYGQTGSGKTHTMSSTDGMIPRAVHQIYETAQGLEEKGWRYTMEGNFVEVYNENLNDLLGNPDELDKKRHEIRHDLQRGKTFITDITTVQLDSPEMVESILKKADANRSVAATKANERSSRSHSVFILKLFGENHITGERSEGTLNLVDLAGSERLSHSKATGDRLRETQNINRSLSSLGDVIAALGQGKEGAHIPYRNSKLTYLLQFSLGGNSKTLMFVMVSPLQAHLSETLTSLKFATKVHNTHIGTAKRQARVRDS